MNEKYIFFSLCPFIVVQQLQKHEANTPVKT
jgi:hypothetical protein